MKQTIRRKLKSLALGELTATIVFIVAWFSLRATFGTEIFGSYSLLSLAILCLILLEGSAYWWLKLRQLDQPQQSIDPHLVQIAFALSMLLLFAYPAAVTITMLNGTIEDSLVDVVIGGGLYIFALGEFVHYFLVKIVRSGSDRQALKRRRQVTARMMRELQRSETRKADN